MECQRCGQKATDDQRFCVVCGWNLSHDMPVPVEPAVLPHTCMHCGKVLPNKVRVYVCPHCGGYIGFNAKHLHPELIRIAQEWTEPAYDFCKDVLGLSVRISRSLTYRFYGNLTPIEILAIDKEYTLALRRVGKKTYEALVNARNNWKPDNEEES